MKGWVGHCYSLFEKFLTYYVSLYKIRIVICFYPHVFIHTYIVTYRMSNIILKNYRYLIKQ